LNIFSSKESLQTALVDLKLIIDDLSSLKKLFTQLSLEDVSHQPHFTKQFQIFGSS